MEPLPKAMRSELTALLIAPDRTLAAQFADSQSESGVCQILSDLKSYPSRQTLEIRIKQLHPDLVIIDAGTDLPTAAEVIRFITETGLPVQVVGLHARNDSQALLTCLRLGACEFLHAPFDAAVQREAFSRLWRLRLPEPETLAQPGTVVVYSSAKPGSGASTLAFHTATFLGSHERKKVLLIDLDLSGGVMAFYSKLNHPYSVLDALQWAGQPSAAEWVGLIAGCDGIDVLPAPALPYCGTIEMGRIAGLFDYARGVYDCVLVDAPAIFKRLSLTALSNANRALVISTGEIASLHLARKAVQLLDRLGFPEDRFQIVVNRVNRLSRNDDFASASLEKLFRCPISSRLPDDPMALHRVMTLGHPLESDSDLGRGIRELAAAILGTASGQKTSPRVQ
jgi:pilus assembly protein CpaE